MNKKFIVDQKALYALLASMQPICSKRTALDITATILFQVGYKELILKSTDLEISLQASCVLFESTLNQSHSFLVSGKRIFELVKELDGPLQCLLENNQLVIETEHVTVALHIKDAQEFPPFPERIENLLHLDAALMRVLLDNVAFLIPQKENLAVPAYNGLLLEIGPEGLSMTALDGYCLAHVRTPKTILHEQRSWLLPRRAVFELKKILETSHDGTLFLGMCDKQLVFSGELFNFFTHLLASPFPRYTSVIDTTQFTPASIDRARLIKTLRRSACLLSFSHSEQPPVPTAFAFTPEGVHVSITNKEAGRLDETIPLAQPNAYTAALPAKYFYAPYLLNGLQTQAFTAQDITFYLTTQGALKSPIIFQSQLPDYSMTYVVMPMNPQSS
jgi:DNA polymerase-3 subunit beta